MRTLTSLALALSLALATQAHAAPRGKKHATTAKHDNATDERFLVSCITERTDGITVKEAVKLCNGIVKHRAKIEKLAQRAAAAIEACEAQVSLSCEDLTERSTDGGACSDETLRSKHAFDPCTGHGPAWRDDARPSNK